MRLQAAVANAADEQQRDREQMEAIHNENNHLKALVQSLQQQLEATTSIKQSLEDRLNIVPATKTVEVQTEPSEEPIAGSHGHPTHSARSDAAASQDGANILNEINNLKDILGERGQLSGINSRLPPRQFSDRNYRSFAPPRQPSEIPMSYAGGLSSFEDIGAGSRDNANQTNAPGFDVMQMQLQRLLRMAEQIVAQESST